MNRSLRISLLFLLCTACSEPKTTAPKAATARKFAPAPQPLTILRNALQSEKSGEQILALQSIGISMNDDAFQLLEVNTFRDAPEVELTKVQVLGAIRTEDTSRLLVNELKSDMMLIRLEALYALAERKYPSCYQHLEAEFGKIDSDFLYIFPELFAIEGSSESKKFLKTLLRNKDPAVRLAAIQSLNQYFPDELIDEMRYLRRDPYPAIQEAVLKASLTIGHRDMQELTNQLKGSCPDGALIVAKAQHDQKLLEKAAIENNVFALDASLPSDLLYQKMQSQDLQVRLNATIALLEKRDPRAYEGLFLLFLPDGRDLYFEKITSPGKALFAYKASPSASQMFKRQPWLYERDVALRAEWLTKAVELPEEQFLKLAALLFKTEQNELIPLLVRLLENVRSERAIALLQKESEHFGSPLIRTACNLSLFRLQVPGPYYERLVEWIARFHTHDLLKPRTILPWNMKEDKERYTLTFEETSNLLIESYEALAESHRAAAITALRQAIQEGNPHNRALLAGLLLKAES